MIRCGHGMLAGLCVVPGCTHGEDPNRSRGAGAPKIRQPKRCERCNLRKPGIAKDRGMWHCPECVEELKLFHSERGKGGIQRRAGGGRNYRRGNAPPSLNGSNPGLSLRPQLSNVEGTNEKGPRESANSPESVTIRIGAER